MKQSFMTLSIMKQIGSTELGGHITALKMLPAAIFPSLIFTSCVDYGRAANPILNNKKSRKDSEQVRRDGRTTFTSGREDKGRPGHGGA